MVVVESDFGVKLWLKPSWTIHLEIVIGAIITFIFIPVVYILRELSQIVAYCRRKMYRGPRVMMMKFYYYSGCIQVDHVDY